MPRSTHYLPVFLLLASCGSSTFDLGCFNVELDEEAGELHVEHGGHRLESLRFATGEGSAEVQMSFGAFLFSDINQDMTRVSRFEELGSGPGLLALDGMDAQGSSLGTLSLSSPSCGSLSMRWAPAKATANRLSLSASCDTRDHFLGLGGHAMDVDHVGQAFPLWVSEPGIGKVDSDESPGDWFITGTRHASSYPVPFLLRPHRNEGLLAWTTARVDMDLCASDPRRFSMSVWEGATEFMLLSADSPLGVVQRLSDWTGRPAAPPAWVFGPWNDAVLGTEELLRVANLLREQEIPSSALWTEDWKGGEKSATGYHLSGEWSLDESLYPDPETLDTTLEQAGFAWLGYFNPFLMEGTEAWDEALAQGLSIHDAAGEVYSFLGVTFKDTTMLDLSSEPARDWALERMTTALDLGFEGWMGDYGEWLPTDASLASGEDAWLAHNRWPLMWQALQLEALEDRDAVLFSRSGWLGAQGLAPVVWAGDQRTSFDSDDGFPSLIPMALGLSASGIPIFTHDIAGYQSVGNEPSDKELFFRWTALGAFSPVMRTHHGAFHEQNWHFDSDPETLLFWARMAREHTRLYPYLSGLAREASLEGSPMIRPISLVFGGEDWARMDAWMLGDSLLVAPVLERGATAREVLLPDDVGWFDWFTLQPAVSGSFEVPLDAIPVLAAEGRCVPTLEFIPDTLREEAGPGISTLQDADTSRLLLCFGSGGDFIEGDGTSYRVSGVATGAGELRVEGASTVADVAGLRVEIEGPRSRSYRVVVVAEKSSSDGR